MGESEVLRCPYHYSEDMMVKLEELKIQLCEFTLHFTFPWAVVATRRPTTTRPTSGFQPWLRLVCGRFSLAQQAPPTAAE